MSSNHINCACLLLNEYFGEIVKDIAKCLMINGSQPLPSIVRYAKIHSMKVRGALRVLMQHNMVSVKRHQRGYAEYILDLSAVLRLMRYPTYISCVKQLGHIDGAEFLIETVLLNGQMPMSEVVMHVTHRLNEALPEKSKIPAHLILDKFEKLVKIQFFQRTPKVVPPADGNPEADPPLPEMVLSSAEMYEIPQINKQLLSMACNEMDRRPEKKAKSQQPDADIYWKVNFDRIHQYMRDQLIIAAIRNRLHNEAAELAQFICHAVETRTDGWAVRSNPVSRHIIMQEIKNSGKEIQNLDKYLKLLAEHSNNFIIKENESQGGTYSVSMKEAVTELTWATIETIVQERFGSKSLRIFRLLKLKKYLEQKQIEEMSMISSKDAKEMTYKMFSENFIHVKEISRTPDHAPSRTFYLFYVDLSQVSQMLLEWCYKTAFNLLLRREMENKESKRLQEKQQRVEAIVSSFKQQGAEEAQWKEIEDMITPAEKSQLEKMKHVSKKIELAELQIDETIFIFQLYICYLKEK